LADRGESDTNRKKWVENFFAEAQREEREESNKNRGDWVEKIFCF